MSSENYFKRKIRFLYNKIVREKAAPDYIARGWAIGMFYGCLIPFGFQLLCSVPTAFLLRGSKIGAVFGTLITNQFTIVVIYPVQCFVGNRLLGGDLTYRQIGDALKSVLTEQSYAALMGIGWELVTGFFLGGALLAGICTPITYFCVRSMVERYRARRVCKEKKSKPDSEDIGIRP